jgi:hypothetical protein
MVAIPLHGAGRWIDVISDNITAIPDSASVVVSDRSRLDDTLEVLRRRHRRDRRIRFVDDAGGTGWREHVNALLSDCDTPTFSILPQDDSVSAGHYEALLGALHDQPDAGLAFPHLRAVFENGDEFDHRPPPFPLGSRPPWEEAIRLRAEWNLGVPWRGVVRRRHLRPMIPTPGDVWADAIWVFGIALETHLVHVPDVVYRKRYHDTNTHGAWARPSASDVYRLQRREIDRRLGGQPDAHREATTLLASMYAADGTDRRRPAT